MYNEEFKKQFMKTVESEHMRSLYSALFHRSDSYEEDFEQDLYDFQSKGLEEFYYGLETPSQHTLKVYHSLVIHYVDYAIEQGVRESNINFFKSIKGRDLHRYVASYKEQYLTISEFNEFMDYVINDVDVAIYRSLFEGIGGVRYSEIQNLKIDDINIKHNQPYAYLTNEDTKGNKTQRVVKITEDLRKDLVRANKQELYVADNGESELHGAVEIVESPYIFRPLQRGAYKKSDGKVNMQTIYRKKTLLTKLTDGQIKNINTLVISGMAHEAHLIFDEKGYISDKDFLRIGQKFDKNIKSEYETVKINHIKNLLSNGLRERYGIEVL